MSEKRTQNKGTKKQQEIQNYKRKEKSFNWVWLGISVLLVIGVIATGVMLNVADIRQTPKMVMKEYFELLSKGKYEEMYTFVSDTSGIEKKAFLEKNKNIYEGIQMSGLQVKFDKEKKKKDKEKTAVVSYQTKMETVAGEKAFYNEASLVKEKGGDWKLVWEPSLIFPELREDDRIVVSTISARRGNILDRNGNGLAVNGTILQVGVVPGKMDEDKTGAIEKIAAEMDMTEEEIESKLSAAWVTDDVFVPLKSMAKGNEEKEQRLLGIKGVMISETEGRVYPLGAAGGHLTGYVQPISAEELEEKQSEGYHENSVIGKSGLELAYEKTLKGSDGYEIYTADQNGKTKILLAAKEKEDGQDVTVTIDAAIQQKAYEQFQGDPAMAVSINPKTGEVMALVSTPAYDPNEFVYGISDRRWTELNEDPNRPLLNRFYAALVPGSTFKPITAAIGMDAGKLDPNENKGYVGLSWQKDASWGEYMVTTLTDYGSEVNLQNALVYSDNIYFARAALDIGADTMIEGMCRAGFEEELPFDIGAQVSTFGTDSKISSEIQLADTGYGQGELLVNPIHLASIYSAFVNEGNMILPVLQMEEGQQAEYWKKDVFTEETAKQIQSDLVQVIENPTGTGAGGRIEGVSLLGKTGTAETKGSQEDAGALEYGWFACETTDGEERPLSVIGMVEDVQKKGGSNYVVSKVNAIMESYYAN